MFLFRRERENFYKWRSSRTRVEAKRKQDEWNSARKASIIEMNSFVFKYTSFRFVIGPLWRVWLAYELWRNKIIFAELQKKRKVWRIDFSFLFFVAGERAATMINFYYERFPNG